MSIEEILDLELDGVKLTINDYCTENYILSYTDKISTLNYPEDKEYIKKLARRILDWYKDALPSIEQSRLIRNKEEHKKTISLLETLVNEID